MYMLKVYLNEFNNYRKNRRRLQTKAGVYERVSYNCHATYFRYFQDIATKFTF